MSGTTLDERPVYFEAAGESLFGMWHRPTGSANGVAVTMLTGAGHLTSSHRNRLYVMVARRLAAKGFDVLRFDYRGVGLSTGTVTNFKLERPFTDDLLAALDFLIARGHSRHFLVGECFGARTVLAASAEVTGLEGVVLMSTPLDDFAPGEDNPMEWGAGQLARRLRDGKTLRGLLDADRRHTYGRFAMSKARSVWRGLRSHDGHDVDQMPVAPAVVSALEALVARGVPILFLYGSDDGLWHYFEQSRAGRIGKVLDRAGNQAVVSTFQGRLHGFDNLDAQAAVIRQVPIWIESSLQPSRVS